MSGVIVDPIQSEKYNLNLSFWYDLYDLETGEFGSEWLYDIALQVKELEKLGFINPYHNQDKSDDKSDKNEETQETEGSMVKQE